MINYNEFTYEQIKRMSRMYYRALIRKGYFAGQAVAQCIERYGVGPHD